MATWQYDIDLIPRAVVDESPEIVLALMAKSEEDIDSAAWWKHLDDEQTFIEALSKLLPAAESWCDSIQMWGTYEGDRIEVSRENDRIELVHARIDVGQISEDFIRGIVDIAKRFDLLIFTEETRMIEPDYHGLLRSIKSSNAARFVKDPKRFLSDLDKQRS